MVAATRPHLGCCHRNGLLALPIQSEGACVAPHGVGESHYMTVVADNKHRVTLRQARPGERFDVAIVEPGKYVLTRLEPARSRPARVRIEKRNGYTVGILDRPIDPVALKEALADFPP
jgi:hypothetical protein